jgi:hypothetical protein
MKIQKQITPEQIQEFRNWVSGQCRSRKDEWKGELLDKLLADRPAVWKVNEAVLQTVQMTTERGNLIHLFYNNETGLVVADLISSNDQGGNEFVRMFLDEKKMLAPVLKSNKQPALE